MIRSLTPQQAHDLLSNSDVEVIDVRDPSEWSEGRLPNARLVPLDQLRANPKAALPRDGVLFVCAAGVRSQTASRIATSQGLTKVYSLSGGTRGWVKAGFQLSNVLEVAV
jgi:rhodanese-related sulfurtransferase